MARSSRAGQLDIAEDIAFQRRAWRVQRFGWGLMALFVAAALLGAFGGGPLGKAREQGPGVEIEYDRFMRRTHSTELRVRVAAPAGSDATRIGVDRDFLERVELRSIAPPPLRVEGAGDRTVFVFGPGAASQDVVFRVKPERGGWLSAHFGRDGTQPLRVVAFVFP